MFSATFSSWMNQNIFSRFVWIPCVPPRPSSLNLLFWNAAAAEARGNAEKIKCNCSLPGSRLPSQLLWWHLPPYTQTGRVRHANDQRGHGYREIWTLFGGKTILLEHLYIWPRFQKDLEVVLVSLNTLLYICKGVRFRKVQVTVILPLNGVSFVYSSSETGKFKEKQLWCRIPPKTAATFGFS